MKELIKKIYETIIYYEKDAIKMDARINTEIEKLLASYIKDYPETNMNEIKELLYQATLIAQNEGFHLGMRYILKLGIFLLLEKDIHKF